MKQNHILRVTSLKADSSIRICIRAIYKDVFLEDPAGCEEVGHARKEASQGYKALTMDTMKKISKEGPVKGNFAYSCR